MTHISQHVLETFGLPAFAFRAVFTGILCVFLAEVQEELVVGKQC